MMYGFGDDANPRQDSVDLVEELMLEYLTQVVSSCLVVLKIIINSSLLVNGSQESRALARWQG